MTGIMQPQACALSDEHRAYLNEHAITDEMIAAAWIWSEDDWIIFPWRDPSGTVTLQRRQWPGKAGQYLWEEGKPLHFSAWRDVPGTPVLLCEGTKQSLAVASWAPAGYSVWGMPGCDGWRRADLSVLAGREVIIFLDADAAENLNVYEAGEKLAERLELQDAKASFVQSPMWGSDGIDDYLGGITPEQRTRQLEQLASRATAKPAKNKPAHRKLGDVPPDTAGLPLVVVNKNRREVINEILCHMKQRWNGSALFCYGGVLTRVRGIATEPLDKDSFARWMTEAVATYTYRAPSLTAPGTYTAAWPEQQTIGAMLASGEEFAPLAGISRAPFVRADGSVCFKNGYDWDPATGTGSQVMLITGNSGMDRLDIPDAPDRDQATTAARFLLDAWLGDMPWRDESSRANALALILTPFIRGIVPLVPLGVISGLQPGVGKGLLADCIQLMFAGEAAPPLPWSVLDDEENRKQITAAFRGGSNLIWFDEAHQIESHALSRAITSLTYADRILGVSRMASFPNRVTWLATGNQVHPSADMTRRSYFIHLHPDMPDPQDRPESAFAHPDLRSWTTAARPELVTAALTIIRAWYAAGQPAFPRGALMGSFEAWDKMMSGILGHAGVPGFLASLTADRADLDTSGGYWTDHLAWLAGQFSSSEFTVLDVKTRAMASGGAWDGPPGLDEPGDRGFARNLGAAYAKVVNRYFGQYRVSKTGMGHRKVQKWCVRSRDEISIPPIPPTGETAVQVGTSFSDTLSEQGGRDWRDESQAVFASSGPVGVASAHPGLQPSGMPSALGVYSGHPACTGMEGLEGTEGSLQLHVSAGARARAHARTHVEGGLADTSTSLRPSVPAGLSLGCDIETADADRLFLTPRGDPAGPGFVRLAGLIGPAGVPVIAPIPDVIAAIMDPAVTEIVGHNFMGFDAIAFAWHHGVPWDAIAPKIRDTELIFRQANPPKSREAGHSADKMGLDAAAAWLGLPGKTDSLARLKDRHGGWDQIPLDDPEYRAYLEGDMHATAAVGSRLHHDGYTRREHLLAQIAGHMSLRGFAVDEPLLRERAGAVEERKGQALQMLHDGWGLPLSRQVMRGRAPNKREETEEFASPLATAEGKAWLEAQFARYQVPDPPRTPKSGDLATGAGDLRPVAADPGCPAELRTMLKLMQVVTQSRTIYQTLLDNLAPDGRVHPRISFRQASGRWSVTSPGLTVMGKRGGRHIERDVLVPDQDAAEPHVLISCDLSQVDMRAMAGHCQDPAYMALFAPGRDVHAEIAAQVFGDASRRQDAKAVGHGWNYGLGPDRMIREGMDPEMVYGFVNGMEARFPGLIAWREHIRAIARDGMILDNGFGRRMMAEPSRAYTVAPALMGQGGARDIMCESLLHLPRELWPYLRVMVHDEIVVSVPARLAAEVTEVLREAMTWTWRDVPILCDMSKPGANWGEISAK